MREHELKTWPEPFAAILDGRKAFEIRRNDRGFAVGDALRLREWEPGHNRDEYGYTGNEVRARVTYLIPGGSWGLPDGLCVMGIATPPAAPAPQCPGCRLDRSPDCEGQPCPCGAPWPAPIVGDWPPAVLAHEVTRAPQAPPGSAPARPDAVTVRRGVCFRVEEWIYDGECTRMTLRAGGDVRFEVGDAVEVFKVNTEGNR